MISGFSAVCKHPAAKRREGTSPVLREQRVAGSNPVIPTSFQMRAAFPGPLSSFWLRTDLVRGLLISDNCSGVGVLVVPGAGVCTPGFVCDD